MNATGSAQRHALLADRAGFRPGRVVRTRGISERVATTRTVSGVEPGEIDQHHRSPFAFALQAQPDTTDGWRALAHDAEAAGFEALVMGDHPGTTPAPFVALANAAAVTDTVALGTAVANLGVRDPLQLAADVATLNVVSGGRALLGVGAGHTPAEWTTLGRVFPSAHDRVDRLIEAVPVIRRLLAGEAVTVRGSHVRLDGASLAWPQSPQQIPLLVGGNNHRLLAWAGAHAEIVEWN